MHFFDADDVNRLLTFPVLIDAIADAHRRPPITVSDTLIGPPESAYFVRNAIDFGRFVGSKLITIHPSNRYDGDLPAIQAICVIFDGANGRPLAIVDGTTVTQWRTAADSALGSRLLARPDSRTLLVVGAGAMARPLARAHFAGVPSLERVLVWNRSADGAAAVVSDLRADGVDAEVADDLSKAVRSVDIVSTCTRAAEPIILGADLRPGVHVDLVGAYTPTTREIDDEAMAKGRVFLDRRESCIHEIGDLVIPLANGTITLDDILGDLHDLVAGRVGRQTDDDITIYENGGGGHLDLIACEAVLRAGGAL